MNSRRPSSVVFVVAIAAAVLVMPPVAHQLPPLLVFLKACSSSWRERLKFGLAGWKFRALLGGGNFPRAHSKKRKTTRGARGDGRIKKGEVALELRWHKRLGLDLRRNRVKRREVT